MLVAWLGRWLGRSGKDVNESSAEKRYGGTEWRYKNPDQVGGSFRRW